MPDRVTIDAVRDAASVSVVGLAVADDRAIAATTLVYRESGSCETCLLFGRGDLQLEEVRNYGPSFVDVELQFFGERRLYVANAERSALIELGIMGGTPDRRLPPVESAAFVFDY